MCSGAAWAAGLGSLREKLREAERSFSTRTGGEGERATANRAGGVVGLAEGEEVRFTAPKGPQKKILG